MLLALYLVLAAYLPLSRLLERLPGHSTATWLDAYLPVVPWLGPVYVLGMVPIALLPLVFARRLPPDHFRRYALATIAGALVTYAVYGLYPTEIRRPPLPQEPLARACLGLAYAARSPHSLFPSGHAFYTALNAWALCQLTRGPARLLVLAASGLVVAAALLTGLHHTADILAGLALAPLAMTLAGGRLTAARGR
jgi:hypothetical protein